MILTPGKDGQMEYKSLRFVSPDQLKIVIFKMIESYAFFLDKKGMLNPANASSIPYLFSKEIEKILKKQLEGEHGQKR